MLTTVTIPESHKEMRDPRNTSIASLTLVLIIQTTIVMPQLSTQRDDRKTFKGLNMAMKKDIVPFFAGFWI
jgi:hypothetical protein